MFDKNLSMVDQITATCKATNFHFRNIGRIRKFFTKKSAETVIHALVTSHLDNNNALLARLPDTQINRLQKLQKTAARIVLCAQKYDSISILDLLHWLPMRERISFTILLLVFKARHDLGPRYLSDMLKPYEPTCSLHS